MLTPRIHPAIQEVQIGEKAVNVLSARPAEGTVLASVTGAVFLKTESNNILWICASNSPLHGRSIRLTGPAPKIKAGSRFNYADQIIHCSPDTSFDLRHFQRWHELPLSKHDITTADEVLRLKEHLTVTILQLPGVQGFGQLLKTLFYFDTVELLQPIQKQALPMIQSIQRACLAHDLEQIFTLAEKLVGLGAGLTPSGDDFLGGLLYTLNTLQKYYPSDSSYNLSTIEAFLQKTRFQTNEISWTLLSDMAHGFTVEPLRNLLYHILQGSPESSFPAAMQKLTSIGHSTGWDMLTGLWVGLGWLHPLLAS